MRVSFFDELKRRNVIRMAGLYLVGAWLIVQVTGTLLPMFDAPAWVSRSIVTIVALGFLPALVFAWVFELTPEGIKRDAEVPPEESIAPLTARRMDRMIIVVLVLALGYFGFDKFVLAPHRNDALVAAATKAATTTTATPNADAHSIAVLPFVNMSGDEANKYFSDGISEEILNVLARTPDLHVAARTSSFSFQGKNVEVPEIALALNVRMVLEGSVRKQDDRVRITAQLIDAKTGFHVWSQTYDRQLQDIFAIQDEIAKAIGDELEVKIDSAQEGGKTSTGTENLVAYDLYLRGIALWQERREDALWQAIDLFEKATAADPKFAAGYAGQALAFAIVGDYSARMPYEEATARARDFAERTLSLDPTLPESYAALGSVAAKELRRTTADALLGRSITLRPSFATAYQWRGSQLMSNGDLEGGLALIERATALDPRSLVVAENHSFILQTLGRYDAAKARCETTLAFAPTYAGCLEDIAMANLRLNDLKAALPLFERLAAAANPGASAQGSELIAALTGSGDRHALAQRYAALKYNSMVDPASGNALVGYDIPSVLIKLGEPEMALGYLEYLAGELGGTADWALMLPDLDPIRCDPRFTAVVQRMKTVDPYAAKVCAGKR
jgi:TolB-like protein